jgi:hypothetical protein
VRLPLRQPSVSYRSLTKNLTHTQALKAYCFFPLPTAPILMSGPAFSSAPEGRVFFHEPSDETRVLEHEARARRSPNFVAKETFTFCEVSIFERLRKIA